MLAKVIIALFVIIMTGVVSAIVARYQGLVSFSTTMWWLLIIFGLIVLMWTLMAVEGELSHRKRVRQMKASNRRGSG